MTQMITRNLLKRSRLLQQRTGKSKIVPVLTSLILLVQPWVPLIASDSDSFSSVTEVQIELVEAQLKAGLQAAALKRRPIIDFARDNEIHLIEQELNNNEGIVYIVAGVCEKKCEDLDLVLYDESNEIIGFDLNDDNRPNFEVTPKSTGHYLLKVIMADCQEQQGCAYAVGIFEHQK